MASSTNDNFWIVSLSAALLVLGLAVAPVTAQAGPDFDGEENLADRGYAGPVEPGQSG